MSLKKVGNQKFLFGKKHTELTKELIRSKALGRKFSLESKLKMSAVKGKPVYLYEKLNAESFNLIGCFVLARRTAKFLGISGSTVIKYLNSRKGGVIFKERYKILTEAAGGCLSLNIIIKTLSKFSLIAVNF